MPTDLTVPENAQVTISGKESEGVPGNLGERPAKVHTIPSGETAIVTYPDGERRKVVDDPNQARAIVMNLGAGGSIFIQPSAIDPVSARPGLTLVDKRGKNPLHARYRRG